MATSGSLRLTNYTSTDVTVERMASGGFGIVFMGPDAANNGEWFALKTLRPELLGTSPRLREMFLREALTWVGLWPHPNVLTARAATEINGQVFLVLDYAEHGSLRELLRHPEVVTRRGQRGAPGRLPLGTGLEWAQQIAAGLASLHTPDPALLRPEPLVHRDLKPENVLIDKAGYVLITDFGLAKAVEVALEGDPAAALALDRIEQAATAQEAGGGIVTEHDATRSRRYQTRRGAAMGTLQYMAPEQWTDAASAGTPADIYAFGVMLSELLAGRHALLDLDGYYGEEAWRVAHANGTPRPLRQVVPELPEAVEQLYAACLAKTAEERPTAKEALAILQQEAETMGERPYMPPDAYPHTPENEVTKWHNWANSYFRFDLVEEALVRNDRAFALGPHDFDVLLTRGNILGKFRRTEEALAAYDTAEQVVPSDDIRRRGSIWGSRGSRLGEAGRHAESEVAYDQATRLRPDQANFWYNRANNKYQWGREEQADGGQEAARAHFVAGLQYLERAIALNPNNADYHHLYAMIQRELANG